MPQDLIADLAAAIDRDDNAEAKRILVLLAQNVMAAFERGLVALEALAAKESCRPQMYAIHDAEDGQRV